MNYKPLPNHLTIKESTIQGLGLFTTVNLKENLPIGVTHIKDERFHNGYIRTPLGGFINHSEDPNCEWKEDEKGVVHMKTIKNIVKGGELTLKYKWYDPEN
tara:strand:- start:11035 stop:11337 length:303 start_codon:yes stop_codon:yes gene_type:complete